MDSDSKMSCFEHYYESNSDVVFDKNAIFSAFYSKCLDGT